MNTARINMGKQAAIAAAVAVLAAFVLACTVFASQAFANQQLSAPTTVSDDITRIHVNKLDADTREYVQGATMAIIEKETGTVVDEWVTGSSTHQNEKGLDVNVVYILREISAPEGYDTVGDVEFVVNEEEGTGITILSKGDDAELVESYKVNLYDKATAVENEVVVTRTQGATSNTGNTGSTSSSTNRTVAPKTGDEAPLWLVGVLVIVGIAAIGVLEIPKRRMKE